MLDSISIAQAAREKGCSRQTIYGNRERFTWTKDGKRIYPDGRFKIWKPKEMGGRLTNLLKKAPSLRGEK